MTREPDAAARRASALEAADRAEAALAAGDHGALAHLLTAAHHCLRAGELGRAHALAERAMAARPAVFVQLLALARLLAQLDRQAEALPWARRAVELRPGDAAAWLFLAGLLLGLKRPREAHAAAETHLARATAPSPRGHHLLATARIAMGDIAGAIEAEQQAVALAPQSVGYRRQLAWLFAQAGRLPDALSLADGTVALAPLDAGAWRGRSGIREMLGDDAGALADAEQAVALAPQDAALRQHRDTLARSLGLGEEGPPPSAAPPPPARRRPATGPRALPCQPGLASLLGERMRAVRAIMLREVRTRHARSRLGYTWALVEPIAHLATLGSVFFLLNKSPPPVGDNLFVFYVSGLLPYLAFSHTASTVASARDSSGGLLHLPAVRALDVPAARALLQLLTETLVAVLVLSGLAMTLGLDLVPDRLPDTVAGFLCLWLIGLGVGLVGMVVSAWLPAWDYAWGALVRLLYFGSGIYYSPIVMPGPVVEMLSWNPILQGIEWLRSGFFTGYEPPWLDRSYLLRFVVLTLLLGLCLERAARHRLRRVSA